MVDPIIDYTAALLMAWGIATALFHRERTGNGQKLDVSLLQAIPPAWIDPLLRYLVLWCGLIGALISL